jgi:cytochrome P450
MSKLDPINIADPVFRSDPYPTYARLREEDPVHRTTLPDGRSLWLITGYEDGVAALKDERLVKDHRATGVSFEMKENEFGREFGQHMLNMDPPEHTRLRSLVTKAFTPKLVEGLRERIQAIADNLLDAVMSRGEMDLINDYAFPLPITVIAEMLGVPVEDQGKIRKWSNAMVGGIPSREKLERIMGDLMEFGAYLHAMIETRKRQPREDLISALVQVEEEGSGKLNEKELLSMLFLLLIAGHETTVNLIGNGVLALFMHPEELEKLKKNPGLIKNAVEELLRYDGPVELSTFRFALEDITMRGKVIPKGEAVLVVLNSTNRDAALVEAPDRLNIEREPTRHLAFGHGVHYCLGAPLARLEGQIAIGTLLRRMPNLRLTVPPETLVHPVSVVIRGLQAMPVAF